MSHTPALDEASNVLVRAPFSDGLGERECRDLLAGDRPDALLVVSYERSPEDCLAAIETVDEIRLVETVIVLGQSAGATAAIDEVEHAGTVTVETVKDARDLTGLGVHCARSFDRWRDRGHRIGVCFDSLTALLQAVGVRAAYRFLLVITNDVKSVNATAHYHMDPDAHGQETVDRLMTLFDAVVIPTEEGRTIRTNGGSEGPAVGSSDSSRDD